MKRSKFTEAQIACAPRQHEAGVPVQDNPYAINAMISISPESAYSVTAFPFSPPLTDPD